MKSKTLDDCLDTLTLMLAIGGSNWPSLPLSLSLSLSIVQNTRGWPIFNSVLVFFFDFFGGGFFVMSKLKITQQFTGKFLYNFCPFVIRQKLLSKNASHIFDYYYY